MKPGHIRVFDGLRITTEHMEHLQNSFHSAVQDLRQILGLGLVHTGFEVTPDGDSGIVIMPGIAFDFQKNRVVSDVPKKQPISLDAETVPQYVCLQYSQVEDNLVEGKPTLVWDSCSIIIQARLPGPDQNLLPIARLDLDEQGKLQITRLPESNQEAPADELDQQSVAEEEVPGMAEDSHPAETSETTAANPRPVAEAKVASVEDAQPAGSEQPEGDDMPPAAPFSSSSSTHFIIRQGILRPADGLSGRHYVASSLLEPVRQILLHSNGAGGNNANTRLFVPLIDKDIPFQFPVASLTVQAVMNGSLELNPAQISAAVGPEQARPLTNNFQVVAQAEATPCTEASTPGTRGPLIQSGLSRISMNLESEIGSLVRLTEGWILEFPFQAALQSLTEESLRTDWDPLRHISLLMSLKEGEGQNLKLSLSFVWEGGVDEASVKWLETHPAQFSWEAHVAWKAMSEKWCPDCSSLSYTGGIQ
jgi:hypothetical protein